MRTTMKELDGDAPKKLHLKNRLKCISSTEDHCSGVNTENGLSSRHKTQKTIDNFLDSGTDALSVTVNEVYQLGIENKENNEIYIFDFVDSLQVSYSLKVTNLNQENFEAFAPFFHDHLLDEHLSCTASHVLSKISSTLESWINEVEESVFISRHLAASDEMIVLRKQVFALLKLFVPNPNVREGFDCTTADLDRYLLQIIRDLNDNGRGNETSSGSPVVVVSTEPEYCVQVLRQRVLNLLQILLPNLLLPESFDLKRDLQDLINAIYSYNMSKF